MREVEVREVEVREGRREWREGGIGGRNWREGGREEEGGGGRGKK